MKDTLGWSLIIIFDVVILGIALVVLGYALWCVYKIAVFLLNVIAFTLPLLVGVPLGLFVGEKVRTVPGVVIVLGSLVGTPIWIHLLNAPDYSHVVTRDQGRSPYDGGGGFGDGR